MIFLLFTLFLLLAILISFVVVQPLLRSTKMQSGLLVLILVPIASLGLYYKLGDAGGYYAFRARSAQLAKVKEQLSKVRSVQQVIERMQKHLNAHPGSAKGWFLLGRLQLSTQSYAQAAKSFDTAAKLDPKQPAYLVQSFEAELLQRRDALPAASISRLQRLLRDYPGYTPAMNLLAVNAYRAKRYAEAIKLWRNVLSKSEPGSEQESLLRQSLAKAQKALRKAPET